MQLEEQVKEMESNVSVGEKNLKNKVNTLENNLEKVTHMYQQLINQKTKWVVENQVGLIVISIFKSLQLIISKKLLLSL